MVTDTDPQQERPLTRRTFLKATALVAAGGAVAAAAGVGPAEGSRNTEGVRAPESETREGAVTIGSTEIYPGEDRERLNVPALFISPDKLGIIGENLLYLRINTDYPEGSSKKAYSITFTAEDLTGLVESHTAIDEQGNRSFPITITDDVALHYALQSKGVTHIFLPDDVNQETRLNVSATIGKQVFDTDIGGLKINKSGSGYRMSTIEGFVDQMRKFYPGFEQVDEFLQRKVEDGATLEKVFFNDGKESYVLPCVKVDIEKMFKGTTSPEIIVSVVRPKEDGSYENVGWRNLGYPGELENQRLLNSSGVMPAEPEDSAFMYFPIVPTENWRGYVLRNVGVESLTPNLGDDGKPLVYKDGDLITVSIISRINHVDESEVVTKYHTGINTCSCETGAWIDNLPQGDPPVESNNNEEQPPGVMQA